MCAKDDTSEMRPDAGQPAPAEADGLLADALEAESAALEAEWDAFWLERELAAGRVPEAWPAGVRAAALDALARAEAEDLLADALEGESEALWVERTAPAGEALPPALRATALAALDRAAQPAPVLTFPLRPQPLRARRLRAPFFLRPAGAAALLLVAVGAVALWTLAGTSQAEAGLQLRALSRVDLGGRSRFSEVQPGYLAPLGHVFTPGADELLGFGLGESGLVVVGGGDAVRVAREAAGEPVLRLESGEARLATRAAPVSLQIDGAGLLVLERGAAHVALHAETGSGAPALALAERSTARFTGTDGRSVPLSGPVRVLLGPQGPRAFGTPARSLFRELEFMGGPLPEPTQVRQVSPRLFQARSGDVRRDRQDLRLGLPADGAAARAVLTWRPPAILSDAVRLRVALRAPAGTRVALAQAGREPLVAALDASASGEPGVSRVELALPADWYAHLPQGRLELAVEVPAREVPAAGAPAPACAWFDGISLILGPSEDGLPVSTINEGPRADGAPASRR